MDILVTAARKSISALSACICVDIPANTYNVYYASSLAAANDASKWNANGNISTSLVYACISTDSGLAALRTTPWCCNLYCNIPTLRNGNTTFAGSDAGVEFSGFKVCAANLTSSACCQWTVPNGVSVARFQIWGAGGSAGSGCCCGGSTWGTSGAYASVIIPVTPGCQYTLCSGNTSPVTIRWNSAINGTLACPSYVTGYGLCNFCAMGGKSAQHYCILQNDIGSYFSCCKWSSTDCFSGGSCICNAGNDFCYSNSCASCGIIPFSQSRVTLYYGCYTGNTTPGFLDNIDNGVYGQVVGIPGLNGCMCFDTNFYGIAVSPPTYGFSTQCCIVYNNGNSCGGVCCNHFDYDYRRFPGAGGTAVMLFSGCTIMCAPLTTSSALNTAGGYYCGGDVGRSGMVCVTYC